MNLDDAINLAAYEVERANNLHPHWPADPLHAVAILAEELGELTQKLLQATYEPKKGVTVADVQEEAVQVAAMGLRFLINFQRYKFPAASKTEYFAPPLPDKVCGYQPAPDFAPCKRPFDHSGPCAH